MPAVDQTSSSQPSATAIRTGDNSVVKVVVDQRSEIQVDGDLASPVSPVSLASPLINTGSESVVKAEIDASQSVSVTGDMVSHKEVHSHQTTNVYRESGVRAITHAFSSAATTPHTSQQCIEKLTREMHSGIGVMPFVVLILFWPVGLYLIVTAGKRKEAKVNELFACLRGFLSSGERRQEEYDRLQVEWVSARRSTQRQSIIVTCVVIAFFVGVYGIAFLSVIGMNSNEKAIHQEIIQLIEEERFGAARIKARALPHYEQSEIVEDIRAAEQRADRERRH